MGKRESSVMSAEYMSQVLDVWKGMFVVCMLIEHTRSSFNLPLNFKTHPVLYVISQIACSLDMTSFTTAYGFSCYRSYFSLSTSSWSQGKRALRSGIIIYIGSFFSNIVFDIGVFAHPPSLTRAIEFLSLTRTYWDFLATFPLLLLLAFFSTRPALRSLCAVSTAPMSLLMYAILLGTPLALSSTNVDSCSSTSERFLGLFFGCIDRKPGAMRFSAISYLFFFNLGAIVAHIFSSISSLKQIPKHLILFFATLIGLEFSYLYPLLGSFTQISWEYLNLPALGHRRFPMTYNTTLAWAFLSFASFLLANAFTLLIRRATSSRVLRPVAFLLSYLEHFGANTLLYLCVNNLWITPFFRNARWNKIYSNPTWEFLTILFAFLSIALARFLFYLVINSRK